jgi:hypothetical protein
MTCAQQVKVRADLVLSMINDAAERGVRAPGNDDIAAEIGASSGSSGSNAIALLEAMGKITVTRYHSGRVITIIETGKSTAPIPGKLHWSVRGVTKSKPAARVDGQLMSSVYRGPAPEHQRVNRDPCPCCGVRRDVGCGHHVGRLGMGAFL